MKSFKTIRPTDISNAYSFSMNTSRKALLVLLACLLFPLMEKVSSAENQNPVVDDAARAEQVVKGLATLL